MSRSVRTLVFINSHPIQYFGPLYERITREETARFDLRVLYLSDETIRGYEDREFGRRVAWDVPLLDGYAHRFVPNNARRPALYNGFFGLLNWGLVGELRRLPKGSIVVSHGWAYASNVLGLWAARACGHTVCLRGDNPHSHERFKPGWKRAVRWLFLKLLVFSVTDYWLYVGEQNRRLYKSLGVPDHRLIFVPHAVDNDRFRAQAAEYGPLRAPAKAKLGLTGRRVILYVGKLIPKKRPMDLLLAYDILRRRMPDLALVYVGDGPLRAVLEDYISRQQLTDVRITGFVNQTDMGRYYALGDVLAMVSGAGETWGLAVNEAMNFALPLVLSDLTGCADDLVRPGRNGLVFPTGDVGALADALQTVLESETIRGRASAERVRAYSYDTLIAGLNTIPT